MGQLQETVLCVVDSSHGRRFSGGAERPKAQRRCRDGAEPACCSAWLAVAVIKGFAAAVVAVASCEPVPRVLRPIEL